MVKEDDKPVIYYYIQPHRPHKLYRSELPSGRIMYSIRVFKKDIHGKKITTYKTVFLKGDPDLPNRTIINIISAKETFFMKDDYTPVFCLSIFEYEVLNAYDFQKAKAEKEFMFNLQQETDADIEESNFED